MICQLNSLSFGQSANIIQISGPNEQVSRLEEFGIRSGVKIRKMRSGIFKIRNKSICLRTSKDINILVEKV